MHSYACRSRAHLRRLAVGCCAVVACFAVAACGGSSNGGGSGGSGGSSTAAPSANSAGASTTASGGASSGVAQSSKELQTYLKAPTKINISTPLKSTPPSGKSVVLLGTSNAQNVVIQHEFSQIAQKYGWSYSLVDYDPANNGSFTAAINTALQKHPDFIGESGTPLTPSDITKVKAAGAKWIPIAVYPIKFSSTVIADPVSYALDREIAKPVADYFISTSNGKGNALLVHVPAYTVLDGMTNAFTQVVKARCPGCTIKFLNLTLPQIANGQVASAITAALKADPSANYLVFDNGGWADGITSALSAAGLSNQVKVIGAAPNQDEMAQTRAGKEAMWSGFSPEVGAIQAFDAMFRTVEGMPVPPQDGTAPTQAITPKTIGSSDTWNLPATALQQYEALWSK